MASVAQIGVGDALDAARGVESRGRLVGHALILRETVLTSRFYRLLVQLHGVAVPPFEAGGFGRHEGMLFAEPRWIVVGPLAQLFLMRRQELVPIVLLVGRSLVIACRHCQGGIVEVVE